MNGKKLIVITGPTASGKSALAVSLAKTLQTEIISADSRQIFKGIPIATAVPSTEEREGITHHLLEILSLDAYYSAAKFKDDADSIISQILKKNDFAIICGGSMLYIDALVDGIDLLPTVPEEIRYDLMNQWKESGDQWLLEMLKILDPDYFETIDLRNLKRVFHAVEISITAGVPYSSLLTKSSKKNDVKISDNSGVNPSYEILKFSLSGPRDVLFDRINSRVLKMIAAGLEKEARNVYHLRHLNSLNTVGLKEMFAWFDGTFTKEEAIARIQKNTRVYAKKQMTWHRRDSKIQYINFCNTLSVQTDQILSLL